MSLEIQYVYPVSQSVQDSLQGYATLVPLSDSSGPPDLVLFDNTAAAQSLSESCDLSSLLETTRRLIVIRPTAQDLQALSPFTGVEVTESPSYLVVERQDATPTQGISVSQHNNPHILLFVESVEAGAPADYRETRRKQCADASASFEFVEFRENGREAGHRVVLADASEHPQFSESQQAEREQRSRRLTQIVDLSTPLVEGESVLEDSIGYLAEPFLDNGPGTVALRRTTSMAVLSYVLTNWSVTPSGDIESQGIEVDIEGESHAEPAKGSAWTVLYSADETPLRDVLRSLDTEVPAREAWDVERPRAARPRRRLLRGTRPMFLAASPSGIDLTPPAGAYYGTKEKRQSTSWPPPDKPFFSNVNQRPSIGLQAKYHVYWADKEATPYYLLVLEAAVSSACNGLAFAQSGDRGKRGWFQYRSHVDVPRIEGGALLDYSGTSAKDNIPVVLDLPTIAITKKASGGTGASHFTPTVRTVNTIEGWELQDASDSGESWIILEFMQYAPWSYRTTAWATSPYDSLVGTLFQGKENNTKPRPQSRSAEGTLTYKMFAAWKFLPQGSPPGVAKAADRPCKATIKVGVCSWFAAIAGTQVDQEKAHIDYFDGLSPNFYLPVEIDLAAVTANQID